MPRSILAIYTISSSTLSPDVYIHIFWIRSPPTKKKKKKKPGSAYETESSGMRGSERFRDFGIRKARVTRERQAATSACFSAGGHSLQSRPAPARGGPVPGTAEQPGHSLACSRGLQKSHVVAQCPEAGRAGHLTVKEEPSWPRPGTLGSLCTRSLGKNTPETWITCKVFVIAEGRKQRHRAFPSRGRRGRPGMPPPRMHAERRRPGALRPPALATPPRPVCLCG